MSNSPPIVAIPIRKNPDGSMLTTGNFPKIMDCVRHVGLEPRIFSEIDDSTLNDVSAVIIPGGGDVDPARYGGDTNGSVYGVDPTQDDLDLWLVATALARDFPLLGICRGAQIINVARGGTLHEDMPAGSEKHHNMILTNTSSSVFVHHAVTIEPNSKVAASLPGPLRIIVPSAHHQCVRDLGADLLITATADDGTIEAFEGRNGWLMALQWHPEADTSLPLHRYGQFQALANEIHLRRETT